MMWISDAASINAHTLVNRAASHFLKHEYDAALADCHDALRLNRAEISAWLWLMEIHQELRQFEELVKAAEWVLTLQPGHAAAHAKLAFAKLHLGQFPAARAAAEACMRAAPENPEAYNIRGLVRHHYGDLQGAIADYDQAVERNPTTPSTFSNRGFAYHQLGQIDLALADYAEEEKRHPQFAVTYNNRGFLYHKIGRFADARTQYHSAIARGPVHPNAYKNLAWLQATCPDAEFRDGLAALANIQRALELDAWRTKAWLEILAAAHAELGNFSDAVRRQSEAITQLARSSAPVAKQRLDAYSQQQPWREPIQPDNPPAPS